MTRGHFEFDNIGLGLAPVDAAGTTKYSTWVDLANAHKINFCVMFGATTSSAADLVTLKVECSSVADSGAESSVPFVYRISGAIGTNTWGAPTAATAAAGYAPLLSVVTGIMVEIEVDPALMLATKSDARYVRLSSVQTSDATALLEAMWWALDPRFKQATMISATTA
jgi:hypothetical protein